MTVDEDLANRVRQYITNHPDAGTMEVLTQTGAPPDLREEISRMVEGEDADLTDVDVTETEPAAPEPEPVSADDIQDHYERITPVMEALARVDEHATLGNDDFRGWYVKRECRDSQARSEGFERAGRPTTLHADYDVIVERIDRVLYAITSYKDIYALADWEPCRYDTERSETVWRNGSPMPDYRDIRAISAWGDVDLSDELKPERGDLDDDTQATVEDTLEAYIDEFETLYGDRDAVFALDSVGGAYVMGSPSATLPIAEHFEGDADALQRVMQEFVERSNGWLEEAQERVEDRVPGAAEVIDPDWVNNKNRAYKAPLSLHKDHDAVVTPLDRDDPTYSLTPFSSVGEDLIEESKAWAEQFTADEHRECARQLVEELWPEEMASHASWEDALEAWVEQEREQEAVTQGPSAGEQSRERSVPEVEGAPITPSFDQASRSIDNLDIFDVAENTIVRQWTEDDSTLTDNSGSGKKAFIPTWGSATTGTANYVDEKGLWNDTGSGDHGTAVEMALISEDNWTRGEIAQKADWARGVKHLHNLGYDVEIWTPDANSTDRNDEPFEEMPYWSVKEAAVALGVLPEDAFIEDEEGVERFPGAWTYNAALDAIEEAGMEHGRERVKKGGGYKPSPEELGLKEEPETEEEQIEQIVTKIEFNSRE